MTAFSKQLVRDIRILLWVVTVGGLALAAYCICVGYNGAMAERHGRLAVDRPWRGLLLLPQHGEVRSPHGRYYV